MKTETLTYQQAADMLEITLSPEDQLKQQTDIPFLGAPQRQGDLTFWEGEPPSDATQVAVTREGIDLAVGQATGNRHTVYLDDRSIGDAFFYPHDAVGGDVLVGFLKVGEGARVVVHHTDEHHLHGLVPGGYRVHGKREMRDEILRVAD